VVVGRLGGYYDISNYRKCDHLIVNTPDLVRHVTENGWSADRVSMITNFGEIPPELDVPASMPDIPKEHKVLLSLGRLHPKKAHDTLIRAMPMIEKATLLIAGSGELQRELEALAADQGVADRVHFLGVRKDISQLFDLADVCVFPSRFEPLGNVVLESWATGTPIVAAASTGPSWLIDHNRTGLLFDVDDAERCACEVSRVLSSSELADLLVKNGRREFQERFSMDVIMGRYKELFERLLASQVSSR
jgi:glycosyltransferase involved in cell wall biosynthesis